MNGVGLQNPNRIFQQDVRNEAIRLSNSICLLCEDHINPGNEQIGHIYSCSTNENMKRRFSRRSIWFDDEFISSLRNAMVLHPNCHQYLDSPNGLRNHPVGSLRRRRQRVYSRRFPY